MLCLSGFEPYSRWGAPEFIVLAGILELLESYIHASLNKIICPWKTFPTRFN